MAALEDPRKPRRRRGATTQSQVVDAALAVADQVGIDRLTIRAVARLADVPTMSLYSHFSSKDELLALMHAEVTQRLATDERYASWQSALVGLCTRLRTVLVAHPHWVPLVSRTAPFVPAGVQERMLELMLADGVSPGWARAALSSALLVAKGLVLLELSDTEGPASIVRAKAGAPAGADTGNSSDAAENFAVALRTYVRGLESAKLTTL
ncbi:MAG TPA: TetR/AcrR family transcriptional regulator [Polyangiaceae bacterium]|nr:TetR/AcrR family transcriptional regulator [Polyangiaceae bacterium]